LTVGSASLAAGKALAGFAAAAVAVALRLILWILHGGHAVKC